jgi:hypothetical protein
MSEREHLDNLIAERDALNVRINAERHRLRSEALAFIRNAMSAFGITHKMIHESMIKRRKPRKGNGNE